LPIRIERDIYVGNDNEPTIEEIFLLSVDFWSKCDQKCGQEQRKVGPIWPEERRMDSTWSVLATIKYVR